MEGAPLAFIHVITKQEDTIQTLRQDTACVWWARMDGPSVIPHLFKASQQWKEKTQEASSIVGKLPLRDVLFICMLQFLRTRLLEVQQQPGKLEEVKKVGLATSDGSWVFQTWCHDSKALKVDESKTAIKPDQLLMKVEGMIKLITNQRVLNRLHSTRRLTEGMTGMVTLIMDIAVRHSQGDELYGTLLELQHNAPFQAIGMQFRKEGYKRNPGSRS